MATKQVKKTPAERGWVNVALNWKLHKRLTKYAATHRIQIGGVIDRAVEQYLDSVDVK